MTIQISFELIGRTPLLCHNIEMANPLSKTAKKLAEVSSKKKKTDADREEMSRLEWFGGLYYDPNVEGPAFPTRNIRKCLIEGARINKLGKSVERAVNFDDLHVPIGYEGSRDLDQLFASGEFVDVSMVRVSQARIARTRPKFMEWAMVASALLEEDVLGLADLQMVAEKAGRASGLGDNRTNGYGKFAVSVKEMS